MLGEALMRLLAAVVAGSLGVAGITDEEYSRFPKLFHLDEWESCLARPGGLYCLGTFSVKPLSDPHPTYDLMVEYSKDPHHFNRTALHRGYCVSSRCPGGAGGSPWRRFQRCAAQQVHGAGLRARLAELSYCRSHEQHKALSDVSRSVDTPHRVFLYVAAAIVVLNLVGTVHDVTTTSDRKLGVLTSWSLVSNWRQLQSPYPAGDPRLATLLPVEGFRVIMVLLVVFVHAGCLHDMIYLQNPHYVEEMSHQPIMMLLQNGSSTIQTLLLLSNFFLADSLLQRPQPPSFMLLPKIMLKRILRIAPVYVLVMGFSATWWPLLRDGPMWPMLVGSESEVCRRKFWPNVLFLQNFIEPELMCQWQTWFLAVDMQLHAVGCVITVCVCRVCSRGLALRLLGGGFAASVVFNSCRAYLNHWMPLMFVSMPNNIRNKFLTTPSFSEYYTSPAGSLPACLLGLFMAHLLHHLRDSGFRPQDHKWLIVSCQLVAVLLPCWTASGWLARGCRSRQCHALVLTLERPGLLLLAAALLFGTYNGTAKPRVKKSAAVFTKNKGFLQHVFSWRGWYPLGRLSLSVLLLHWTLGTVLLGVATAPIHSSVIRMVADFLATAFLSYLLAVPVTLMVELPFQNCYSVLLS